jgi:PIN domain nuclease of toxin-antitoxin system
VSFLADACALVAFHGGGGAGMTDRGRKVMRGGDVLVSPITVWEITRKAALGKLPRPVPPGFTGSLSDYLRSQSYRFAPLGWDEAEHANRLPMHHADPMDRMLIATALIRDLTVITSDSAFAAYGVPTVW